MASGGTVHWQDQDPEKPGANGGCARSSPRLRREEQRDPARRSSEKAVSEGPFSLSVARRFICLEVIPIDCAVTYFRTSRSREQDVWFKKASIHWTSHTRDTRIAYSLIPQWTDSGKAFHRPLRVFGNWIWLPRIASHWHLEFRPFRGSECSSCIC
jgi:hypothetical protein